MQGIVPSLWFDTEAVEATAFYASVFPSSRVDSVVTLRDTPSGACDLVSFTLAGQPFMAISAGPFFRFNPSISFLVRCGSAREADEYWERLADGGAPLLPLDTYPFAERFGWVADRYGLSWQLLYTGEEPVAKRILPALMFAGGLYGRAEEAITFWGSVFAGSGLETARRLPDGALEFATFTLAGREFAVMENDHDHGFGFNEAISFVVRCDTQEEIDRAWGALSAVPEAEMCGWLADRFGVSWQVAPAMLDAMMHDGTEKQRARVTQAFLGMKKFDLAAVQAAYDGREAT